MYMCGWVPLKSRSWGWITCSRSYMGALWMCFQTGQQRAKNSYAFPNDILILPVFFCKSLK